MTTPDRHSTDAFLGGRIALHQSKTGYRAAMDPVLLAAAVPDIGRGRVLDLGCGNGAALLCYGARVPGPDLVGLELDGEAADLARVNAEENGFDARCTILQGDIMTPPDALTPGGFDQVFANPPYLDARTGEASPIPDRARSNVEGEARLKDWVSALLRFARPKGGVTIVHRADRTDEILALLSRKAGDITVIPLWPRLGQPAKRVIIRARKGVRGGTVLHPGLVLHGPADDPTARYTPAAAAILRDGAALV
ncbi:tRNA1(Val) (adenine(37)-N6)-methyltransferase [Pacificispira spongiicola]|nr:methyltransferase [Pacificispira spongiicola]